MKAKDVVTKIVALERKPGELPGEFEERQVGVLLDCGLVKFKANCASRFPSGKTNIRSIVSLRREFGEWGDAIVRIGQFPWMRPGAGIVVFDTILREVEKQATGGDVLSNMVVAIGSGDLSTVGLRTGL